MEKQKIIYDDSFDPYEIDVRGSYVVFYRGFRCYPYLGVVINESLSRGYRGKDGVWRIKERRGKVYLVSRIIYAAGFGRVQKKSFKQMRLRIVRHKNKNKNDNRYGNLKSNVKKINLCNISNLQLLQ